MEKLDLEKLELENPIDPVKPKTLKERAIEMMGGVAKGLDYPSIATRGLVGRATGTISQDELEKALRFEAPLPGTSDMLARKGWNKSKELSELPGFRDWYEDAPTKGQEDQESLFERALHYVRPNLHEIFDPSARGAVGFVGDMAMDPLNLVSMGAAGAAKEAVQVGGKVATATSRAGRAIELAGRAASLPGDIAHYLPTKAYQAAERVAPNLTKGVAAVANAPANAMGWAGKKLYEGSLGRLGQAAEKKGKQALAEALYSNRIRGTKNLDEQYARAMGDLRGETQGIRAEADAAGAVFDKNKAFQPFLDHVQEMVNKNLITPEEGIHAINDMVAQYHITPSLEVANEWKTSIGKKIPASDRSIVSKADEWGKLRKTSEEGVRAEIERATEASLGQQKAARLKKANSDLGYLLDTQPAAQATASRARGQSLLSPLDIGILSGEVVLPNAIPPGLLAAKKAMEFGTSANVKSRAGYWMRKAAEHRGTSSLLNATARRKAIDKPRPDLEELDLEPLDLEKP